MAYTWEIYGDTKATYTECFRMFNPSTKQVRNASMRGYYLEAALMVMTGIRVGDSEAAPCTSCLCVIW